MKPVKCAERRLRIMLTIADYTSPVFFWTVIELALAVISACLPTLRPIYLHFNPPPAHYRGRSEPYISVGRRYGKNHYGCDDSVSDEFGVPLTEREPGVQTRIDTIPNKTPDPSKKSAIMISQTISSVHRQAESV